MSTILETERLILRNYKLSDVDDFYEFASLPDVGPRAGWKAYTNKEQALEYLKKVCDRELLFAVVLKEENKVIGSIEIMDTFRKNSFKNLNPSKNSKELGCVLSSKYWHKGYMTEVTKEIIRYCFEELELDEVYAATSSKNIQSNGLQEKCGLKLVSVEKDNEEFLGEATDKMLRRLTKDEYFNKKRGR